MTDKPWEVLPQQFLERIKSIIPSENLEEVLNSFSVNRPSTFRVNILKTTSEKLKEELAKLNIEIEQVEWYKDAFILKNVPQKVLTETEIYKNGLIYIQSLSSMIPALVLNAQPNEKILDITAAPGSKTTQIAAMMENTGEIVANDISRIRLYKLEANIKLQGVTNTKITYKPGQIIWKDYPEYFDKALVDVPCSLEGRFKCDYPKSYRDWSPGKVRYLSQMQKFLLRSAVSATKVGGIIVYSTCTLEQDENEGVIDWILKKEKGAIAVEKIYLNFNKIMYGLTQYGNKKFDKSIENTVRILPSSLMEGFFVAKIKKIKSNLKSPQKAIY